MEISNSRLKLIFNMIWLFASSYLSAQDTAKMKSIVKDDLITMDLFFEDRLFLQEALSSIKDSNITVSSMESIGLSTYDSAYFGYNLIELRVRVLNLRGVHSPIEVDREFSYFFLQYHLNYYKLLGFFTSDINLIRSKLYTEKEFRQFMGLLSRTLIEKKKLTEREGRFFRKAFLHNYEYYPKKINRDVNVLNSLFPSLNFQSYILPYSTIKPIFR